MSCRIVNISSIQHASKSVTVTHNEGMCTLNPPKWLLCQRPTIIHSPTTLYSTANSRRLDDFYLNAFMWPSSVDLWPSWCMCVHTHRLHVSQEGHSRCDLAAGSIQSPSWIYRFYTLYFINTWSPGLLYLNVACMWMHVDGRLVDVQYSNWQSSYPQHTDTHSCVVVVQSNEWLSFHCNQPQRYVCQS